MKMKNETYDFLKKVALIYLPAISAAYFGLAQIWGWPYGQEVVGSIAVIDTFLGAILQISNGNYDEQQK